MQFRRTLALAGAMAGLAVALAPATALAAAGTTVTVRVEGLTHTLLGPTVVHTHPGSITKGGTPAGRCSATSAAGALDVATHHHWKGRWNASYGALLLTGILGETHTLASSDYWSIWVDDTYASSGLCGLRLHRGEHVLLAAIPDSFNAAKHSPLTLTGPSQMRLGSVITVKVVAYTPRGKAKPLAGATVSGDGVEVTTGPGGLAQIPVAHAGELTLQASDPGDIRSAPLHIAELP